MASPNLILNARIESLQRNLEDVAHAVTKAAERHGDLNRVARQADDALETLEEVSTQVGFVQVLLKKSNPDIGRARDFLKEVLGDDSEDGHPDRFEEIAGALRDIKQLVNRRTHGGFDEKMMDITVNDTLAKAARALTRKLDNCMRQLNAAHDGGDDPGDVVDDEHDPNANPWDVIFHSVAPEIPDLYDDYVDLLRGVALRDTRLDSGICEITDALMNEVDQGGFAQWRSLTVPSPDEAISVGLTRIIRLGFGDWSMWSIPLAAAQYGRLLLVQDGLQLGESVQDALGPGFAALVSDAFASYVMGPAYAAAAIVLKLQPRVTHRGPDGTFVLDDDAMRVEKQRAYVILEILERLDTDVGGRFARPRQILQAAWNEALVQNEIDATVAQQEELDRFVDEMFAYLHGGVGSSINRIGYTEDWFTRVAPWPENLLEWYDLQRSDATREQAWELIDPRRLTEEQKDVRHVLNTAWLCRLEHPDVPAERIRIAARRLLDLVPRGPESSPSSAAGTPRPARSPGSAPR